MSLPPLITDLFKEHRNVHFASNPCRIYFKNQTIVICRDDLIEKMCRSSIYVPLRSTDISNFVILLFKMIFFLNFFSSVIQFGVKGIILLYRYISMPYYLNLIISFIYGRLPMFL